jgi:hypothetical protein
MAVDPLADLFGTGAPVAPAQQDDPLADLFGPTPVAASTARAAPEKTGQPQQFYDGSFFGELGEGIASGVIGIGEGLAGLGAAAVDVVADTTYGDSVTAGAEAIRDALGFDPEGFVGKGAEIVTQFVVPGIGAAAKVGSLAKAARAARGLGSTPMTKAERFALAGKELAAAGVVDAAVSTDGMTTIGDWVDMGPTQTSDLIGLRGREKALARINNKLKIGVESTLLGGVAQGALMTAGKTIGDSRIGQLTAKAASARLNEVGKNIDTLLERRMFAQPNTAEELGFFKTKLADAIAFSRYRGFLPEQIATKRELIDGQVQTEIKRADRILKDFETSIDTFLKRSPEGAGNLDRAGIMSKLESYLTEPDAAVKARLLGELPVAARVNAVKMREHIDGLSKSVLGSNFLKQNLTLPDGTDIKSLIEENINTYLRRRYKIFEDSKYVPTAESTKVADDFFRANRKATEKELTEMARGDVFGNLTDDFLRANGLTRVGSGDSMQIKVGARVTNAAAQKARENFLGRYSIKSREKLGGGRMARDRLETGMFMTRESVPKALRQLLGEVDDPREAYLGTIADLAQFTAVDDYFGTIANLSRQNSGIGKLFVDGKNLSQAQQQSLRNQGFVQLGGENGASSGVQAVGREADDLERLIGRSGWGTLDGFYVPMPVYKNLTNAVLSEDSIGTELLRGLFGSFLKAKGISQYSKTVLSPITQVRNLITAAAFATANGNVSSSPQLASTVAKFQQGGPIQTMAPERSDLGGAMPLASAIHGPSGMMYGQMSLQQLLELANSGDRLAAEVLMMLQPPTGGTLPDETRARLDLVRDITDPDSSFGRQLDQFSARLADFGTQPRVAADLAGMDAPSIDAVPTIALDTAPAAPRQAPRAVPQGAADTVPSVTPSFLSLTPSLGMPSAPDAPLPSAGRARATRVGDRTFVLTDDGRVLDAQTGAPATPEVEAEVRSRLSPQLNMMDIVGGVSQIDPTGGGVNPSFRENDGPLSPMPPDFAPMTVPTTPVNPTASFDMDAYQSDLAGVTAALLGPGLTAIDELPYDGPFIPPAQPYTLPDLSDITGSDFSNLMDSLKNAAQLGTMFFPGARLPASEIIEAAGAPQTLPEPPVADTPPVVDKTTPAPTLDVDLDDPDTYDTNFEEMMRRLGEATGKEDKSSRQKAMADLAMIGLAIAAGQSPDALTNIAQGALTGVKAIRAEDAATSAADRETRSLAARMASEATNLDREIASRERIARMNLEGRGDPYAKLLLEQTNALIGAGVDAADALSLAKLQLKELGLGPTATAAPIQMTAEERNDEIRRRIKVAQDAGDTKGVQALRDSIVRQKLSPSDFGL